MYYFLSVKLQWLLLSHSSGLSGLLRPGGVGLSAPSTRGSALNVSGVSYGSQAASFSSTLHPEGSDDATGILSSVNWSHLLPGIVGSLPLTVSQTISSSNIINSVGSTISHRERLIVQPESQVNCNLFFIQGNIRVCQGWLNGDVPWPPFDLAIARFERRSYLAKSVELKTPTREQAVQCVWASSPLFVWLFLRMLLLYA